MILPTSHLSNATIRTTGFCRKCDAEHSLAEGNSRHLCEELMEQFDQKGTIALSSSPASVDDALATSFLFGEARGKMFGVLECMQPNGSRTVLKAFSGQYNGLWLVEGWVPPLFEVGEFFTLTHDIEKKIKQLGREISQSEPHSEQWLALKKKRRMLSRNLMQDIHKLYALSNFSGETATLAEAFWGENIPTGTGDCCGPKLLNYAARNNLLPLGMAEFYWGKENRSGSQSHGHFSSSCKEKCQPILGFMLCGIEE